MKTVYTAIPLALLAAVVQSNTLPSRQRQTRDVGYGDPDGAHDFLGESLDSGDAVGDTFDHDFLGNGFDHHQSESHADDDNDDDFEPGFVSNQPGGPHVDAADNDIDNGINDDNIVITPVTNQQQSQAFEQDTNITPPPPSGPGPVQHEPEQLPPQQHSEPKQPVPWTVDAGDNDIDNGINDDNIVITPVTNQQQAQSFEQDTNISPPPPPSGPDPVQHQPEQLPPQQHSDPEQPYPEPEEAPAPAPAPVFEPAPDSAPAPAEPKYQAPTPPASTSSTSAWAPAATHPAPAHDPAPEPAPAAPKYPAPTASGWAPAATHPAPAHEPAPAPAPAAPKYQLPPAAASDPAAPEQPKYETPSTAPVVSPEEYDEHSACHEDGNHHMSMPMGEDDDDEYSAPPAKGNPYQPPQPPSAPQSYPLTPASSKSYPEPEHDEQSHGPYPLPAPDAEDDSEPVYRVPSAPSAPQDSKPIPPGREYEKPEPQVYPTKAQTTPQYTLQAKTSATPSSVRWAVYKSSAHHVASASAATSLTACPSAHKVPTTTAPSATPTPSVYEGGAGFIAAPGGFTLGVLGAMAFLL